MHTDPLTAETHSLVLATFALAVAAFLAIIVPLIVSCFGAATRRRIAISELKSVVATLEQRLESITQSKGRAYGAGAGIAALCGRVFSNDIASALRRESLAQVYRAVADASDIISAYATFTENVSGRPVVIRGDAADDAQALAYKRSRENRVQEIREAASEVLSALRQAGAVLK